MLLARCRDIRQSDVETYVVFARASNTAAVGETGVAGVGSDQPAPDGDGGGLAPVGRPELVDDVGNVRLDGAGAEEERRRHLGVGLPLAEQGEDLLLTTRQDETG